jgi:cell wall assembly regulator SMI1
MQKELHAHDYQALEQIMLAEEEAMQEYEAQFEIWDDLTQQCEEVEGKT